MNQRTSEIDLANGEAVLVRRQGETIVMTRVLDDDSDGEDYELTLAACPEHRTE